MGKIPDGFKDQIRDLIRVTDVAGRHVKLKRAGREMVGLSPFTNEKTPSFYCNDQKQFWHCFSSGKHGDVFSLLMELENLTFPESVQQLADKAGLDMPEYTPKEKAADERRKLIYTALQDADDLFRKSLAAPEGREARDYLKSRGIDEDTIRKWGLGYAPAGYRSSGDALKHHDTAVLLDAGILVDRNNGRGPFGFYRNRLTIPVHDRQGRVVTFSARALDPDGKPKYLNGAESPVFSKSRTLYGAQFAKNAILKDREAQGLVLSEGCMDVIALSRAGIDLGVAPLGTSVTDSHLNELWRYGPEPIVCLDGDAAGQRAAGRVIEMALPRIGGGKSIMFARLPQNQDPDDILRQGGPEALRKIIANPIEMPRLIWERERDAERLDTPERRAGFRSRLDKYLAQINDQETKRHYREAFFQWTRALYRRGHDRQTKSLQGGSVVSHRGMGVLIRCIDNPDLLAANDEALGMVSWSAEAGQIYSAMLEAYMANVEISRDLVIDSLLANMQQTAASAIERYPVIDQIKPDSPAWRNTCRGIEALQDRPEAHDSLQDALAARRNLKKIRK